LLQAEGLSPFDAVPHAKLGQVHIYLGEKEKALDELTLAEKYKGKGRDAFEAD
jgi:hypothetical protein